MILKNKNQGFIQYYCLRTKKNAGFTLTEIVSVIGLFLLVALITFGVFNISQRSFTIGDRHLEISQNGRIFLDRLTRELRQTQEIVTPLPATKNVVGFPPANEIEFQNGHDADDIRYLRYYLDGNLIKHQSIVYFFADEPNNYVYWNTQDEFGVFPTKSVLEEKTIAEYINQLWFYGSNITYIEAWLTKATASLHLYTGIWGRNNRL